MLQPACRAQRRFGDVCGLADARPPVSAHTSQSWVLKVERARGDIWAREQEYGTVSMKDKPISTCNKEDMLYTDLRLGGKLHACQYIQSEHDDETRRVRQDSWAWNPSFRGIVFQHPGRGSCMPGKQTPQGWLWIRKRRVRSLPRAQPIEYHERKRETSV
jgi:hypothetical protein